MVYKKPLPLRQRAINLKSLIEDSLEFKFAPFLIRTYQKQLIELEKEIKSIKENEKQRETTN